MANLGNVWHLPEVADPRGTGGMRDPIGAVVAGAELIVRSGNQYAGPGNAGARPAQRGGARRPAADRARADVGPPARAGRRRPARRGCRPVRWDPATETALPQTSSPDGPVNLFCAGHAFQPDGTLLVAGGHHLADGHGLPTAFVYHPGDDRWERIADMNNGRRYPTATCLSDGSVLVTSGSFEGPGGAANDLEPQVWRDAAWHPVAGLPGKQAFELYPRQHIAPGGAVVMAGPAAATWYLGPDGQWRAHGGRAAARRDYAPTAQYRDDRVLFLGGGNDQPDPTPTTACEILDLAATPQDSAAGHDDTHADAQLFSPPYLFAGPRPTIVAAPLEIDHGASFTVEIGDVGAARVTLVRLGAVTHARAMDQRWVELTFTAAGTTLAVTAPATPDRCPPGPYLLFVLSAAGVPSVAAIVRVRAAGAAPVLRASVPERVVLARRAAERAVIGTAVTVGIDGVCPYGLGACWGGANEALRALAGVAAVDPVPDQVASTATVHLDDRGLPALDVWTQQFHRIVNGSYRLRGVEVELAGCSVTTQRAPCSTPTPTPMRTVRTSGSSRWPRRCRPGPPTTRSAPPTGGSRRSPRGLSIRVTGPLARVDGRYPLQVRLVVADRRARLGGESRRRSGTTSGRVPASPESVPGIRRSGCVERSNRQPPTARLPPPAPVGSQGGNVRVRRLATFAARAIPDVSPLGAPRRAPARRRRDRRGARHRRQRRGARRHRGLRPSRPRRGGRHLGQAPAPAGHDMSGMTAGDAGADRANERRRGGRGRCGRGRGGRGRHGGHGTDRSGALRRADRALGVVVTDGEGRVLYGSDADQTNPPQSRCTGACAQNWQPLTVPEGQEPQLLGVDAAAVGQHGRAGRQQPAHAGRLAGLRQPQRRRPAAGDRGPTRTGWFAMTPQGGKIAV